MKQSGRRRWIFSQPGAIFPPEKNKTTERPKVLFASRSCFCCYSYYNSPIWPDKSSFTSCIHNKRFIGDEKEEKSAQEGNKEVFLYYYFLSSFAAHNIRLLLPGAVFLFEFGKIITSLRGWCVRLPGCTLFFIYCE
jgi:hypothetical protein